MQLVTVRMLGRFLPDSLEVSWVNVERLAEQVDVEDPSCLKQYAQRLPTQHEHAREITSAYGYRPFEDIDAQQEFREFVAARAWTSTEGPRKLFERAAAWLLRHKVLLPGLTTLAKRVAEIRDEQAQRLYTAVGALASPEQAAELEQLVQTADRARLSEVERLRRSPTDNTPTELTRQVERLGELRAFELAEVDVSQIPPNRLWHLARYGLGSKASTLRGLSPARKTATLVAMVRALTQQATDDALDMFDVLVRENLIRRAERESAKTRLQSLPRLSRASTTVATELKTVLGQLRESGQSLDADAVWTALETAVGQTQLTDALNAVEELTVDQGDPDTAARAELLDRFPTIRKAVASLVEVPFGAAEGGSEALTEFGRLPQLFPARCRKLSTAQSCSELVGSSWRRLVLGNPDLAADQVDQRAYIPAVTEIFHSRLRRGDVFACGGLRWADPREKLLAETQWQAAKPEVLTSLELSEEPQPHLAELMGKLDTAYRIVADRAEDSEKQATTVGADGRLHLDKLVLQEVSDEQTELSRVCAAMLPQIDLPDLIMEVHGWTGCLDEYTHLSEADARMSELPTSVAAYLVAERGRPAVFRPARQGRDLAELRQRPGRRARRDRGHRHRPRQPARARRAAGPRRRSPLGDGRHRHGQLLRPGLWAVRATGVSVFAAAGRHARSEVLAHGSGRRLRAAERAGPGSQERTGSGVDPAELARPAACGGFVVQRRDPRLGADAHHPRWWHADHTGQSPGRVRAHRQNPAYAGLRRRRRDLPAPHTQLNTQESRHALARRIFHGKRGQLYQPYRQGQEDQLGALGLVLNMVRYAFISSPPSELRPLRDPTDPDDEL